MPDRDTEIVVYRAYVYKIWDGIAAASWAGYQSQGQGCLIIHSNENIFRGKKISALMGGIPLLSPIRMAVTYISLEELEKSLAVQISVHDKNEIERSKPTTYITLLIALTDGTWFSIVEKAYDSRLSPPKAYKKYEDIFVVSDYIDWIYNHNHPQQSGRFDSIVEALVVTQSALLAYLEKAYLLDNLTYSGLYSENEIYLDLYGAIQSLIVQQDAIEHLVSELKMSIYKGFSRKYPVLKSIRNIRNRTVGHPTLTNRLNHPGKKEAYSIIVPIISPAGFALSSVYDDGEFSGETFDLFSIISDQQKYLRDLFEYIKNNI